MNPPTILIFDQEEAVRDSLHLVLSEEGFQCFTATNNTAVLDLLSSQSFDMLLLDSQVPDLLTILEKIHEVYPSLNTILISSYAQADVTQQALNSGADDFVLKPLDFDEIIAQVKKYLIPASG